MLRDYQHLVAPTIDINIAFRKSYPVVVNLMEMLEKTVVYWIYLLSNHKFSISRFKLELEIYRQ